MGELYATLDMQKSSAFDIENAFLERFSAIQILRANEAFSCFNSVWDLPIENDRNHSSNAYYSFATTNIRQYKTEFFLKKLAFHYVFDATSDIHGFLNNYMNIRISAGEGIRRLVYKEGDLFRCKGDDINEGDFGLLKKAKYEDYFAIFFGSISDTNVILFDLALNRAHVICSVSEIDKIVGLMREHRITLSKPVFKVFEGSFDVKTNALLFKPFMTYYLHIEAFASKWVIKSPDKSVNDYIFYENFHESTTEGTDNSENPKKKTYEYVKMTIDPIQKLDMITNVFNISFVGNDKNLLLPFVAGLVALITKIENLPFTTGRFGEIDMPFAGSYMELENEFIRQIQRGRFDIDRHVESFCCFRMCKKRAFINAFASFTEHDSVSFIPDGNVSCKGGNGRSSTVVDAFSRLPVNYRPLSVPRPFNRRLNGESYIDSVSLLRYACFYDSLEINPIFNKRMHELSQRGKLYHLDDSEDWVYHLANGQQTRQTSLVSVVHSQPKVVLRNTTCPDMSDTVLLQDVNGQTFMDYPLEGVIKGLTWGHLGDASLPRRKANKVHGDKLVPVDSFVNNILLQYAIPDMQDGNELKPSGCEKLTIFSIDLITRLTKSDCLPFTFKEYVLDMLGKDCASVLLSQHLWDYNDDQRITTLDEIDVELQQDLLQHVFGVRILYFVFEQKRNEYVFREPRHNGWYAIDMSYDRVMFVFKAKNDNLYTPLFECNDVRGVGTFMSYSVPLTAKVRSAYNEVSVRSTNELVHIPDDIKGQLIDSYGKSVGYIDSWGNAVRYEPRTPVMRPRQNLDFIVKNLGQKRTYLVASWNFNKSTNFAQYKETLTKSKSFVNGETRQTMQNLSVLFKTILKYIIWKVYPSDMPFDAIRQLLETLIVERDTPFDDRAEQDRIYRLVKMPSLGLDTFLEENYSSVFWEGTFHVQNAPKTRLFLWKELCLMAKAPKSFFQAFLEADLDINLVRQEEGEMISLRYLEHARDVSRIGERLLSNTDIVFAQLLTSEIIFERRYVLTRIGEDYHLVADTAKSEIETACFVCKHWLDNREVADYNEARILSMDYEVYQLVHDNIIFLTRTGEKENCLVKILQYEVGKRYRYASLLPI